MMLNVRPDFGYPFESASVVASGATSLAALKIAAKTTVAFSFICHCLNRVRNSVNAETRNTV